MHAFNLASFLYIQEIKSSSKYEKLTYLENSKKYTG